MTSLTFFSQLDIENIFFAFGLFLFDLFADSKKNLKKKFWKKTEKKNFRKKTKKIKFWKKNFEKKNFEKKFKKKKFL